MEKHIIEEGCIRAVKDTSGFGGCNNWHLQVKNVRGHYQDVQFMYVGNIQELFSQKLPVYSETKSKVKRVS